MSEDFYPTVHTLEVREIGKVVKLTDDALFTAIDWLESYEINICDDELDADEQTFADGLVTVADFLRKELQRRENTRFKNAVWAEARAKGWDKANPAHRKHVNGIIAETIAQKEVAS